MKKIRKQPQKIEQNKASRKIFSSHLNKIKGSRKKCSKIKNKFKNIAINFDFIDILAPSRIIFTGDSHINEATIKFLNQISIIAKDIDQNKYVKKIRLNFEKTCAIYPSACASLFSHLEQVVLQYPLLIFCIKPTRLTFTIRGVTDIQVTAVLKHLKFYELLKLNSPKLTSSLPLIDCWHTFSSDDQGIHEKELGPYLEQIERKDLYRPLCEALFNTFDHAYPTDSDYRKCRFLYAEIDSQLEFIICDAGIGIPESLRRKTDRNVREWLDSKALKKDAAYIQTSLEYNKSRTGDKHRGQGSRDFINFINKHVGATLKIFSGKGFYQKVGSTGNMGEVDVLKNNKLSINGTIIQFSIPLINQ